MAMVFDFSRTAMTLWLVVTWVTDCVTISLSTVTWPGQKCGHQKIKPHHFVHRHLKMIIMTSHVKLCIFATTKKLLDIFKKSFIQMKAMDHIYHFYKPEVVINEVSQKSSKCKQVLHITYINVWELDDVYLTTNHLRARFAGSNRGRCEIGRASCRERV